ncbi:transposase [Pseudanabaena sp. FACHB-2040]|nr:transposase [Pseudanabaena sp. FACHB-2040]
MEFHPPLQCIITYLVLPKTKPELAVELINEVQAAGFKVQLVLADSFYGESSSFIACVRKFEMPFIVAIRSNYGVLIHRGKECATTAGEPLSDP